MPGRGTGILRWFELNDLRERFSSSPDLCSGPRHAIAFAFTAVPRVQRRRVYWARRAWNTSYSNTECLVD